MRHFTSTAIEFTGIRNHDDKNILASGMRLVPVKRISGGLVVIMKRLATYRNVDVGSVHIAASRAKCGE